MHTMKESESWQTHFLFLQSFLGLSVVMQTTKSHHVMFLEINPEVIAQVEEHARNRPGPDHSERTPVHCALEIAWQFRPRERT